MAKYIVYVEHIITIIKVTTIISPSYVYPHVATMTRISSYAKRSGYRRRELREGNAYAVAINLEHVVAARCTPLHKGLEAVLYRNGSTLPSGFSGLVLQHSMLTDQAFEVEPGGSGLTWLIVDVVMRVGVS